MLRSALSSLLFSDGDQSPGEAERRRGNDDESDSPRRALLSHFTGRAVEAFSLWADANQKILRELVDLSAITAKEGVRLYAEIQSSAVEAVKEGHSYLLRRQSSYRMHLAI